MRSTLTDMVSEIDSRAYDYSYTVKLGRVTPVRDPPTSTGVLTIVS